MKKNNIEGTKFIIIDLVGDLRHVENLRIDMHNQDISLFDSIDDYLSDGHMQKDEKIKTFQDLFYDDYMSKIETILIITNMSKKEWRRLVRSINNNTFYPIKKIRIVSDDPIKKSMLKIKFTSNLVVNDFYEKYHSGIDDDSIWRNIHECPYCHSDNFIIINDIEEFEKSGLSIGDSGVFGFFGEHLKCGSCNQIITSRLLAHIEGCQKYLRSFLDKRDKIRYRFNTSSRGIVSLLCIGI